VLGEMTMIAEGVETTRAAHALAQRAGIEMPIVAEVHAVLFEGRRPRGAGEPDAARTQGGAVAMLFPCRIPGRTERDLRTERCAEAADPARRPRRSESAAGG
jgi:hypothetical protein